MMSPENLPSKPPGANKDENQQQGSGSSSRRTATGSGAARPPEPQVLKCPRCDSSNTKFCYYNNYSLSQPRHFCKACRRYWTKGGALRNVPIGGGCRKNKKLGKSTTRLSSDDSKDYSAGSSYSDLTGLKFFSGLSPAMDFQLGGLNLPKFNISTTTPAPNYLNQHLPSFGDTSNSLLPSTSSFVLDLSGSNHGQFMGFNIPLSSSSGLKQDHENGNFNVKEMGTKSNLASSIESLSSLNQDLHWKLQQQRLAMMFGGGGGDDQNQNQNQISTQKPEPILFQNLEISSKSDGVDNYSRKENQGGNLSTEWYFDNSNYATTTTNSNTTENGNGIQGWSNFDQYTALP